MAISDRITSIEEHIKESYQELEGIGIDTTGVNNNLENIPKLIDGYWETLPKVTGEGTSITLDNTKEGKMKINLKGNTSQATTTGKNLLSFANITNNTAVGITRTINQETITLNGTTTGAGNIVAKTSTGIILKAGTYTGSITTSGSYNRPSGDVAFYLRKNNTIMLGKSLANMTTNGQYSSTFTLTEDTEIFLEIYTNASNITFNNYVCKFQLEKGSTATEYEPYTNGASPNPDYPQDVHVVTGDNSIEVCGKNLLKPYQLSGSHTANGLTATMQSNGTMLVNGTATGNTWIEFVKTFGNTSETTKILYPLDTTKTYIQSSTVISGTISGTANFSIQVNTNVNSSTSVGATRQITGANGVYRAWLYIRNGAVLTNAVIGFQLEEGTTASPYEANQGNTYNIDLPVENLFELPATQTINGITYSINDDKTINLSGTATANATFILYKDLADSNITNGDTYTFFANKTLPSGVEIRLEAYNGTSWLRHILGSVLNSTHQKITNSANLTNATRVRYHIYVASGTSVNISNLGIQLEKGSKQNNFTPYGTTPIELCKIGDYQDSIKKSTGKNLLKLNDIAETTSNGITYSCTNGEIRLNGTATGGVIIDFESFYLPSGNYYLSRNLTGTTSGSWQNYLRNASASIKQGEGTFTTNGENVFFRLYFNSGVVLNNVVFKPMLNEGSTALPYEPYGKVWYLNKQIGKVVFTGGNDETWNISETSTSGSNRFLNESIANLVIKPSDNSVTINTLSNNFVAKSSNQTYLNQEGIDISSNGNLHIYSDTTKNYTVAQFKTWLSTHNTIVYYPLATPTYTEITDSTLISQLNALAKSYTSQTNISQESNDLASLLNATALEEM